MSGRIEMSVIAPLANIDEAMGIIASIPDTTSQGIVVDISVEIPIDANGTRHKLFTVPMRDLMNATPQREAKVTPSAGLDKLIIKEEPQSESEESNMRHDLPPSLTQVPKSPFARPKSASLSERSLQARVAELRRRMREVDVSRGLASRWLPMQDTGEELTQTATKVVADPSRTSTDQTGLNSKSYATMSSDPSGGSMRAASGTAGFMRCTHSGCDVIVKKSYRYLAVSSKAGEYVCPKHNQ